MTDPTPLAEQIAREHTLVDDLGLECSCGLRPGPAAYSAHIATVAERAVRERVAALLEHEADLDMEARGERVPGNRQPLSTPISRRLRRIARDVANGAPDA